MEEDVTTTITKTYRDEDIKMVVSIVNEEMNYIRFYRRITPGKDKHLFSLNVKREGMTQDEAENLVESLSAMFDKLFDLVFC